MTRLTLICHASTLALKRNAFPLDEPIEAAATAEAAAVAATLRRVDHARASPALRARQTAEAMRIEAAPDPGLRDLDVGRWAGRRLSDLHREEPDAVALWLADPAAAPHGGETLVDLRSRVGDWLGAAGRLGGHMLAVTHPAVIRVAILHALDAPMAAFWRIDVVPLSVSVLTGHAGIWNLRALGHAGDVRHAPARTA